jgi:phospholipid/cholesterol/gamma-HCH transport system substrate-binding protein
VRGPYLITRAAAIAALALVVVGIAVVLLSSGSSYQVKVLFLNASQLVPGDQVEVAGNSIGTISNIATTPDGQAAVTLSISNSSFRPLHQGTQATVREPGLSSIAARYVDLTLGPQNAPVIPSGGLIQATSTTSEVDLDELINALDARTRKGIQDVFQGSASQYLGRGRQAGLGWEYLNPAIATSSLLFQELNRNTPQFTRFIVNSDNLVTDLAERHSDLSGLISHLSTTFSALASEQTALGQSIQRLPPFMRLANTTFVNLRNALVDLTTLINASRPVAPKLQRLLEQIRPLAVDAVPTVRNLANLISRRGPNNDLIELTKLAVPLAQVTVGGRYGEPLVLANGTLRPGAFTVSQQALHQSVPELAVARPYAVDLTGWFEGFSHPGTIDANGAAARVATIVGLGAISNGALNLSPTLLTNAAARAAYTQGLITTGQGDRCPGSMERGPTSGTSATSVESGFPCDQSEVPTGP